MTGQICKACGSTAIRSVNRGFNGWFLFFWIAFGFCVMNSLYAGCFIFMCLALGKTVSALFQRRDLCEACGSGEVIPADSPLGRKLMAELAAR